MKKTVYTCDFCVKDKAEKEVRNYQEYDICSGCTADILNTIFKNPLLFPNLKLTPFCRVCNGRKYIIRKELSDSQRLEEVEYPCPECFK